MNGISRRHAAVQNQQAVEIELKFGSAQLSWSSRATFPERGCRASFQQRFSSCPDAYSDRRLARHVRRSTCASCGAAAADTVTTNFEAPVPPNAQAPFQLGSVNGQDGWKSDVPGDIPSLPHGYDQAVVANSGAPPAFGGQSLRISNAYGTAPESSPPEFELQTYSKPTTDAAGEKLANTVYTAQFSFISVHPDRQPGLLISVSPDNGHGGRMSYIGLDDMADGIHVIFYDTPNPNGDFAGYDLRTLSRDAPHTIKFFMRLVPGPDNDLVRIFIDGQDFGQCFTTWETFYRARSQARRTAAAAVPQQLQFRDRRRLAFRAGYLFDNVTVTTGTGPGPPGCDMTIDKQADAATVRAGGLEGYRSPPETVAAPSPATSASAITFRRTRRSSRRPQARRVGRAALLRDPASEPDQRVSVHLDLRVDATAPPGTVTNIADVTPGVPRLPSAPGAGIGPSGARRGGGNAARWRSRGGPGPS